LTYIERPGPEKELLLVLTFFRFPNLLDQRKCSSRGQGETLTEKRYFSEKFYKFNSIFPQFLNVLISPKPYWKATAVVGNLFLKPRNLFEATNKSY
jgi:hypothetical protein